jgi:hypothetical protein
MYIGVLMSLFKICSKCNIEKSFESFSKNSHRKDGLYPSCKQCVAEYNKINKEVRSLSKKAYYEANKETISAKAKEAYSENRDVAVARSKKYREANREYYLDYLKNYYADNKEKFIEYAKTNSDKIKLRCKLYRENNIESVLASELQYREENREVLASRARNYYLFNRDKCIARLNEYRKNNPEKFAALVSKRRSAKLNATPKWLTKEHLEQIEELFLCARMFKLYTGEEYHVDHIVPLQGKTVCGLHVPWNLQVIPAKENLSKSNKI